MGLIDCVATQSFQFLAIRTICNGHSTSIATQTRSAAMAALVADETEVVVMQV
jgi:hypothetical protein